MKRSLERGVPVIEIKDDDEIMMDDIEELERELGLDDLANSLPCTLYYYILYHFSFD